MKKIPKIKKTSVFSQKIIITVPPWGVFVFTFATCAVVVYSIDTVTAAICVILTFFAAIAVWTEHRMVNELRHQVHNLMHHIEYTDFDEEIPAAKEVVGEDAPRRISVKR